MRPVILLLTLFVTADLCAGEQLYRWVDDQGQVHFSDQPPSHSTVPVQIQPLPPPVRPPTDDRYSVMNQVKRLEGERQQLEAARRTEKLIRLEEARRLAEIEAARAQARQADAEAERARQPVYIVYPWFRKPPRTGPDHRPDRPDRPPRGSDSRPDPPDGRSLTRPGRSLTVPGRSLHPAPPPPDP